MTNRILGLVMEPYAGASGNTVERLAPAAPVRKPRRDSFGFGSDFSLTIWLLLFTCGWLQVYLQQLTGRSRVNRTTCMPVYGGRRAEWSDWSTHRRFERTKMRSDTGRPPERYRR